MTEPPPPAPATRVSRWTGIALPPPPSATGSYHDPLAELEGLRSRLASQPVIEQSKGILMGRYQLDPDAAFEVLRRWSSHTNRKLRDISEMIVNATRPTGREVIEADTNHDLSHLIDLLNHGQIPDRPTGTPSCHATNEHSNPSGNL